MGWPKAMRCPDCGKGMRRDCASPTCNVYLCPRCNHAIRLVKKEKDGAWSFRRASLPR